MLQSKYIDGTNEQYSIRIDGEVIQHYKLTWAGNITKNGIDKCTKKYGINTKYVNITKNGKNNSISINTLLAEYFNFKFCAGCKCKLFDLSKIKCNKCIKEYDINYNDKARFKILSRGYIAHLLQISEKELSDDLYELYKIKLKTKRLLSHKTNKSIHSFK